MNDRLITAAGAAAALLILYLLFAPGSAEPPVTIPVSDERGRNGYFALTTWLEQSGVETIGWRERFDALSGEGGPGGRGNILLTTMPYRYAVRQPELQTLREWIDRGNTLLIAAALNDTPDWSVNRDTAGFIDALVDLSGLRFYTASEYVEQTELWRPITNGPGHELVLDPLPHPLMDGVGPMAALSDESSAIWRGTSGSGNTAVLALARDRASSSDAAWQRPSGLGQVIVFASGSLFANHKIADADQGRFVANLVARHLGPDGVFLIDDMHQGVTTLYDPAAFFADSRLHWTIGFLIAAWLAYLLGATNRLAPAPARRREPQQSDLLEATGAFLSRRLDRVDAGLLLFDEWFDEVRERRGIDSEQPPWAELERTPTLDRRLLASLREQHEKLISGRKVDIVQLHNLLRTARKAIG